MSLSLRIPTCGVREFMRWPQRQAFAFQRIVARGASKSDLCDKTRHLCSVANVMGVLQVRTV